MIQLIAVKAILSRLLPFVKYIFMAILILGIVLAPYYVGKADGKREYKVKAQGRINVLNAAAESKVREIEDNSKNAADKYENNKKVFDKELDEYKRKYINEKQKNTSYSNCHAGDSFMQYYRKTTSGTP